MKLKLLPLLMESIQDNPIINIFKSTYTKNKGKIDNLYLTLMSYNIHDVLNNIQSIMDIERASEKYAQEVDNLARGIDKRIESMSEEEYNQNEQMIEDVRNEISHLNQIVYYKHSSIERICYGLTHMEETISDADDELKYGFSTKKAFSDIKTIDV